MKHNPETPNTVETNDDVLQLIGDILSHDLSNMLITAQSSIELAQREVDDEQLERTAETLHNAEDLVETLALIARTTGESTEVRKTNIQDIAESAWMMVQSPQVDLECVANGTIRADASLLRQLLKICFKMRLCMVEKK